MCVLSAHVYFAGEKFTKEYFRKCTCKMYEEGNVSHICPLPFSSQFVNVVL